VRWEESVERIAALGVTVAVELGAGRVLGGLVKRIAKSITPYAAGDPESLTATVAALAGAPTAKEPSHG
jgi:[acyl-carrier-protein] S-malonyltransferase